MDRFRAYLVDDESLALKRLTRLLIATNRVEIVGSATDPNEALRFLSANTVDVLFLDIQMTTMNGFELLSRMPTNPRVIFTTAYDEYAVKAFDVNAVDYLLKPVDPKQLERAMLRLESVDTNQSVRSVLERIARERPKAESNGTGRIWSKSGDKISVIDVREVSHIYARDKLTYAATENKHYIVDFSIAALENMLSEHDFIRVHRSTLINLAYLDELHRWFGGGLIARLKDPKQTKITVARNYAKTLKARLGII